MSHRFTSWWRALGVVLIGLATLTWPAAAQADATARVALVHQDASVSFNAAGFAAFATTLKLPTSMRDPHEDVSIYPALLARSQLAAIVDNTGTTAPALSSTGAFPLSCVHHQLATFSVLIATTGFPRLSRSCDQATPRLRLACASTCGGVYPLRYDVTSNGVSDITWSLLAVGTSAVSNPLHVALVETLPPSVLRHSTSSLQALQTLSHFKTTPLTLGVDYQTLASAASSRSVAALWRAALSSALASPLHRAIDAPPANVDFAGLATYGLTTQIPEQLNLSANLLLADTGRYVDLPVLVAGSQSDASLLALDHAGVSDLILPERDLAQAPSSTLSWGTPFHVDATNPMNVLSTDGPLSALASNRAIGNGRRAALVAGTLAFLHYEEPNVLRPRTVVISAPVDDTSAHFLSDLVSTLHHDPFAVFASLTPSFSTSLVGANGSPRLRPLGVDHDISTWSTHNVTSLLVLIGNVTSVANAEKSGDEATALRVAVARSEIRSDPSTRQDAINSATDLFNAQLSQFSIDASAITLAGQGTSLPITILSRAPYHLNAVVHLVTDRLSFPSGNAIAVTLDSPTKSIRVPATDATGGSLTLQVVLTTPNDQVILARSAIQVRIAGTSVVGYVLTFASLFVLAFWWWRTNRRRPKGRHAR